VNEHIVVVDDAAVNLAIIGAIVGDRAHTTVHTFESSRAALDYAGNNPVDAFILDYHMPAPNGQEMIRILRADGRFAFVPIIIVTAEHEHEPRLAALAAGANDFIERPIEPRELMMRLDTLLGLHAARQRLSETVTDLERSLEVRERQSREKAARMVALWRIVTNADLATEDLPYAILFEGARAIRPSQTFFGTVARLDGDHIVIEAKTRLVRGAARPGTRIPFEQSIQSRLGESVTTIAWNDVADDPEMQALGRVRETGLRSAICTSFFAGRARYYLDFWSREPVEPPFTSEDYTYIELLASFFGSRMQQAWQLDRLTYHLAHDTLTGLRNRTQFRIDARAAYATAESGVLAVVALDRFRFANETYGHIIGDALLVEVGAALERCAIHEEIVARLAGDTFGIFLPGFIDEADAKARLATFAAAFDTPFSTGDREGTEFIPLTASIGATASTDTGVSIDTLLSRADTAVYAAKRQGGGRIQFFEPGMESEEAARDRLRAELALALLRNEFELYLQPHIDLETDRVTGAEALIRWNHPTRGVLTPEAFIPFAEQNGLIRPISTWVMNETFRISEHFRKLDPSFRTYFNLSALDLSDMAIADAFRDAAARGVHVENVGVELTETAAMQDMGVTMQTVRELRELGVSVAIDDFGIGYSSLALLNRLPVDVVKIDRTFVNDILAGEREAAIPEAVIAFGRLFNFQTLGEGVETDRQRAWLAERGCRYAQGYNIARPQPLAPFTNWLASQLAARVGATSEGT
jgi:diguanylate cyclase (GGDEF)-like protein